MANTTLRRGSSGSDVKKMQQSLIDAGYDVGTAGADGIYGSATEAAVRKYQQDNGLVVDGVAGNQTLGKLYTPAQSSPTTTQQSTPTEAAKPSAAESKFEYSPYTESDTVKQAQAMLDQQLAQKPGQYESQWQSQLDEVMNKILNREKFSYDLNGDALYQQYKDQYTTKGKMAMLDTMGQAQAMTGGYGNSYAQSVGQQAYQGYLQQLNDVIPELYKLALDKYNNEGQDLYNQFALLGDRESMDYDRYRDQVGDWQTERDYLTNRYDTERDYDYGKYADERDFAYGQFSDDKAYAYQQERDQIADQQWQAEFDEAKRQYDQNYAASQNKSSGGSSNRSSSSSDTTGNDNNGYSSSDIKKLQNYLGVTADGKFGPETMKAMRAAGWTTLDEAMSDLNGGGTPVPETPVAETNPYDGWDAGDWEGYFANIRQNEGTAAAQKELSYLTSKGLIPKNMVSAAASGARGGQMGH